MGELAEKQRASGRLFVDRIEDNGVAVLIGPVGKDGSYQKFNVPAERGWKEGQYVSPPSATTGKPAKNAHADAAGFYLAPPTGMDPTENEAPGPKPDDTSLIHLAAPTSMDPTANPAPVMDVAGRKADAGLGEYLDNHQPVQAASLRAHEAGTLPWDWYAGGPPPHPTPPMRLPGGDVGPAPPVSGAPPGAEAMLSMPSGRGRERTRRKRTVP